MNRFFPQSFFFGGMQLSGSGHVVTTVRGHACSGASPACSALPMSGMALMRVPPFVFSLGLDWTVRVSFKVLFCSICYLFQARGAPEKPWSSFLIETLLESFQDSFMSEFAVGFCAIG